MEWFGPLVFVVAVAIALVQAANHRHMLVATFQSAAAMLPDARVERGALAVPSLRVERGRLSLEVRAGSEPTSGRRRRPVTRFVLSGLPRGIGLVRQGLGRELLQLVAGPDHLTGDEGFDRGVTVSGDAAVLTAVLDGPTRQAVWALLNGPDRGEVAGGQLVLVVDGEVEPPGPLVARIEHLLRIGQRLCVVPSEVPSRIAGVATRDRDPGVRRRAAQVLVERFQGGVVDGTLRELLRAPDPALRALAATRLGDPEGLASVIRDPLAPASARAEALLRLAAVGDPTALERELDDLLRDPEPAVRRAAMRSAARIDPGRAGALLRRVRLEDAADRVALAEGIARVSGGEGLLLGLLDDVAPEVRLAAARALAEVGTVAAVPALRTRARERLGMGEVAEAARAAVERIQARLGPVEAGRLALADEDAPVGAVSLAGEAGRVTVADDPTDGGRS